MLSIVRQYKSVNEAMAQIGLEIAVSGDTVKLTNAVGDTVITKELMDYSVCFAPGFANICTLPERKFPIKGAQSEFLWYMTGIDSVAPVERWLKNWSKFADEHGKVNSNYGVYWHRSIPDIIQELAFDKHSRRAVMNIYQSDKAPFGKDTPCTLTLQFLIRHNQLHLICNMRSNDIWYGFPIDVLCNSLLQQLVCHELRATYPDLQVGTYRHHAGSLHAYLSESSGNATLSEQLLGQMYSNFASGKSGIGERLELAEQRTFSNFWNIDNTEFDDARFSWFKNKEWQEQ